MRGWFRSVTRTLPGGRARSSRARRPRRSSPTSGSRSTVAVLYAIRRIHDLRRTLISLARSDGAKKDILRLGTHGRDGDIMEAYTTLDWEALCLEVTKLRVERRKTANVIALPAGGLLTDFLQSREKARSNAGFESGGAGNRMGGFVPSVGTSRNAIPPPVRGRATSWRPWTGDIVAGWSRRWGRECFCKTLRAEGGILLQNSRGRGPYLLQTDTNLPPLGSGDRGTTAWRRRGTVRCRKSVKLPASGNGYDERSMCRARATASRSFEIASSPT